MEISAKRIRNAKETFVRSIDKKINWNSRLIGIKGARGCGKTTLLLQHLKNNHMDLVSCGKALFVSLDNIWFAKNSLLDLAESFSKNGGKILYVDEVHRYEDWPIYIKNIYDDYPELKVVFTGSSLLQILDARADLSRRPVMYNMQGLSFREFLNLKTGSDFKALSLEEILKNHSRHAFDICGKVRPFEHFNEYLKTGYYPFFTEGLDTYYMKLEETINMILDVELPLLRKIDIAYVPKIKKLLAIIAESSPFTLNASKIAGAMELNRATLISYLKSLADAKLIYSLFKDLKGVSSLQKPDKVFLENTNLMYLYQGENADAGNVRETFLVNQLSYNQSVEFSESSDFFVNDKYTIECGGKSKSGEQIKNLKNAFVAADGIETGSGSKIPLWLFGFLY
ncbi:MAG: ATP-binding protein [Treponema sp.]|nr:ATP-binding protein [Treponema sp.]MBP5577160.1 ATP-binding protein [Treponema sp.]